MENKKHLLAVFLSIGLIFYGLARAQSSTYDAPGESIIQCVITEELELDLTKGQICHLRFFLRCRAEISVFIIDAYDYQVRQLVKNITYERGTISLEWDGKDDQGNYVPAGAYIPFITAQTEKKERYIYDPRETTGWRQVLVSSPVYDASKWKISFTLDQPAYVRLRVGSHDGLLYDTLMDWEYRYKGENQIPWDGKDPTGVLDLTKSYKSKGSYRIPWNGRDPGEPDLTKSYVFVYRAMSLPENVTCVIDSPNGDVLSRERPGVRIEVDREQYLAQANLNSAYLIIGKRLSPRFKVELNGSPLKDDIPTVSGVCRLNVEIDKADVWCPPNRRIEVSLWIDDIYVNMDRKKEGYTPSVWQIDTTKYSDGLHVVTVMVECPDDRIGAHSFVIKVRNKK